jgi:hypothetical protein
MRTAAKPTQQDSRVATITTAFMTSSSTPVMNVWQLDLKVLLPMWLAVM